MTTTESSTSVAQQDVVLVEIDKGVAWITLNRPNKRNAMSPQLNRRMMEVLDIVEQDDRCGVVVLTGQGDAFSAGMDLQEYFRAFDGKPRIDVIRSRREATGWWHRLRDLEKPTIAMVNGWCFGGAFTPLYACDLAIAAEEAQFGLSEINWGIVPAGNVTHAIERLMSHRDSLYYVMTGKTFDGVKAAAMGVVNEAVPLAKLRQHVRELADVLLEKNPLALNACKQALRTIPGMHWDQALDYLNAKNEQLWQIDTTQGRKQGQKQFLDEKTYKPGLGSYNRDKR